MISEFAHTCESRNLNSSHCDLHRGILYIASHNMSMLQQSGNEMNICRQRFIIFDFAFTILMMTALRDTQRIKRRQKRIQHSLLSLKCVYCVEIGASDVIRRRFSTHSTKLWPREQCFNIEHTRCLPDYHLTLLLTLLPLWPHLYSKFMFLY